MIVEEIAEITKQVQSDLNSVGLKAEIQIFLEDEEFEIKTIIGRSSFPLSLLNSFKENATERTSLMSLIILVLHQSDLDKERNKLIKKVSDSLYDLFE